MRSLALTPGVDKLDTTHRLKSMGGKQRFVYNPESPAQRRANALALADEKLHARLLAARKTAGLSQQDIANIMGVSQPTVAAFERYDNDPRLSTIRRYAHAVGVVIEHLVTRDDGNARCEWESHSLRSEVGIRVQSPPEVSRNWIDQPSELLARFERAA